MQICFLFGSGISVPAGYPSVGEITNIVLSGREPNAACELQKPSEDTLAFARWLKTIADARYCSDCEHEPNYEDIFFLASQIHDDLVNEYDNPALASLVKEAILRFWVCSKNPIANGRHHAVDLSSDVMIYIRRFLEFKLDAGKESRRMEHLNFISEAIGQVGASNVCLLTVNHDTLLETFLSSVKINDERIKFADGFGDEDNQTHIRKWTPSLFSETNAGLAMLKLHGGRNWIRFRRRKAKPRKNGASPWSEEYVGIPGPQYDRNAKDDQGCAHEPANPDEETIFLIGTFNKMSSYTDPVYLELYYRAYRELERADALVTVGYGFGDKGINKLVADWLCYSEKRRIVVVDKNCECEVRERSRGAISRKWEHEAIGKRFRFIQRDLTKDKITWQEIHLEIEACKNAI
jgi:hypothetical protein